MTMSFDICVKSVQTPVAEFCNPIFSSIRTGYSTSDDTEKDPYYDEDAPPNFFDDNVTMPMLGENMMRKMVNRDPYDVYEPVKVLGTGSMGSVNMVKKRNKSLGGSARYHNLTLPKKLELEGIHPYYVKLFTLPVLGSWFRSCAGLDLESGGESPLKASGKKTGYKEPVPFCGGESIFIDSARVESREDEGGDLNLDITYHSTRSVPDINAMDNSIHGIKGVLDLSHSSSSQIPAFLLSSKQKGKASTRTPRHVFINAYLNKQRAQGKFDFHYALKSIHLSRVHDPLYINEMKNEIEIMKTLDHCHIVRPLETYEFKGHIYMIMELCSGGDLYSRDPYTEEDASRIVGSLLSAVSYMHEHNIVHRDLKYENIMFVNSHPQAEVKIIDFGLSKKFLPNQKMRDGVGTIYTMAPEVLRGEYTSKADVWSIGVLAYMLLSSQMPFYGRKRRELTEKISTCEYDFKGRQWSFVSDQAKTFVSNLLVLDPDDRPTAEEAKRAMWLNSRHASSVSSLRTEDDMSVVKNSLEHYSTLKKLQKLALMVIAHKSSSEEIGFLRRAFKRYDLEKKGTIGLPEFRKCLLKYNYSDAYLKHLFQQVDLDGTGEIKYTEFLAATVQTAGLITEERLAEAFDRLDSDDSGFITMQNLRDLLGDEVSQEYLEGIMKESDLHKDKRISYDDFLSLWEEVVEDTRLVALRGISQRRTVMHVADDLRDITSSDDEGITSSGSESEFNKWDV